MATSNLMSQDKTNRKCIIIGAGLSGLVAAKELLEVGIKDITLLEKRENLGGVWQTHAWPNATLTSSKWITEFGSFPMPNEYPDFPTPQQMVDYLISFSRHFRITEKIRYGVTVKAIEQGEATGCYHVVTDKETFRNCDFVVVSTGLHGKPVIPDIPGRDAFKGTFIHGHSYHTPEPFRGQRVLCIGLGESGVGISSEISSVADNTIVSGGSFTPVPRIYPFSTVPYDQVAHWQLGKYMKDFQELVTIACSWYNRLPPKLNDLYAELHPLLKRFPKEWLPEDWIPYRWHSKYWPHPGENFNNVSGNLTYPDAPTDDLLYLINSGQIEPKGKVTRLDSQYAYFADGSRSVVDAVVFNTGYQVSTLAMQLPNNWAYRHQDLYKGCFHPKLPNVAFIGLVRPTIGSIPAMAEMQARLVAQVFSGRQFLPAAAQLKQLAEADARKQARKHPTMKHRLPHVYFFEAWMDEMAELIGCQPRFREHLNSWQQLRAFWVGATLPLRFRLRGPGAIEGAKERYANRTTRVFSSGFGRVYGQLILWFFFYPHLLSVLIGVGLFFSTRLSEFTSLGIAIAFWGLYMSVDLFRFIVWIPVMLVQAFFFLGKTVSEERPLGGDEPPDYSNPTVFQCNN